ncbi:MAG: GIY-YIG nuclease family protein [Candidatus Poribacteria bacterium]|nr:GIY-YIG nuclease family protein [Candidatus Poribacteria bacterium]
MARDTNARIEANLRSPKFKKLLEEARLMVKPGKKMEAARHVLKHMDLKKDENDPDLFWHIRDRQLAELLGMPNPKGGGKTVVFYARERLKQERLGIEKVVKKVDASKMRVIGSGNQFVYLYYFPAYKLNSRYYIKYVDDSHETPIYECNIGKTVGDVKTRVSDQIGQQLPEKARIALVIRTDDCDSLETEIHDELKRRRKWLDPVFENVVGEEWFLTNPAEVERIVKSIHSKKNSND